MQKNNPMYIDLLKEISNLPSGARFQINELCSRSVYYKKSDMPAIGRLFKSEVISGNVTSVVYVSLKSDNHNIYKKM